MCIDVCKTFAIVKQTSMTLAMGIVQLSAWLTGIGLEKIRAIELEQLCIERGAILETMLDLLDIYFLRPKSTKVGAQFEIPKLVQIKIEINEEVDKTPGMKRYMNWCDQCEKDGYNYKPTGSSVKRATRGLDGNTGPMRFVFDPERAQAEKDINARYLEDQIEEYEIEIEEEIGEPEPRPSDRGHYNERGRHFNHRHRNNHGHHNHHRRRNNH
jgi:CTD kinase subunit beta